MDDTAAVRILVRELHDAALAARPFVVQASDRYDALLLGVKHEQAAEVLDRLDGALADAGELLSGATS